jgi:hypothetical protein
MLKDIIINLPYLTQKKQGTVLELLNELGFRVTRVKMTLNKQRIEISVSPDFCYCLCCGAEIESKTFKSKKSNYMCRYCSSGSCDVGEAGYEDGHGQLEKASGTAFEDEEDPEEDEAADESTTEDEEDTDNDSD